VDKSKLKKLGKVTGLGKRENEARNRRALQLLRDKEAATAAPKAPVKPTNVGPSYSARYPAVDTDKKKPPSK
jgi:hypothetical protein